MGKRERIAFFKTKQNKTKQKKQKEGSKVKGNRKKGEREGGGGGVATLIFAQVWPTMLRDCTGNAENMS